MVAADSKGNIYVTDIGNYRVQKFDGSGQFLAKWGSEGTGAGQFKEPAGIAVDKQDNVYVADVCNNVVQKFDDSGKFLLSWGDQAKAMVSSISGDVAEWASRP